MNGPTASGRGSRARRERCRSRAREAWTTNWLRLVESSFSSVSLSPASLALSFFPRLDAASLRRHRDLFPGVLHNLVRSLGLGNARALILADKHDAKRPLRQHAGKLPLPVADGQRLLCLIPVEGNRRVRAFLIVVVVVLVFVEREFAVGPTVDAKLNGIFRPLRRPFQRLAHRNHRPRANVNRHAIERGGSLGAPRALNRH